MKRPKKNEVKLGFDLRHAGMGSKEDVVTELNLRQAEWEKNHSGQIVTEIRDAFQHGGNCIIGGECWAGQRIFTPARQPKKVIVET